MNNTGYNKGVHSQLTLNDFATSDVALTAGQWSKVGYKQVGITEEIGLGFGSITGLDDAQGRVYGKFLDGDGNVLNGEIKYVIEDTQGNTILALPFNMALAIIRNGETSLRDRMDYPFQDLIITRERQIAMYLKVDTVGASGTLDVSASEFEQSITRVSL